MINNTHTPREYSQLCELKLRSIFEEELKIGKVKRVDFIPFDNIPTDGEKPFRSAYVHFEYWCDNYTTMSIRRKMELFDSYRYKTYYDGFENQPAFKNNGYLMFKINRTPIPDADGIYNIHQLSDIKTKLEKENAELKEENEKLKRTIAEMTP